MRTIYTISLCLFVTAILNAQQKSNSFIPDLWINGELLTISAEENETSRISSDMDYINFNPAIDFKKLDEENIFIPYDINQQSRLTFFSVYQSKDGIGEQIIWSVNNSDRDIMLTTKRVSGPGNTVKYEGGNMKVPVMNTIVQYWGSSNTPAIDEGITIGSLSKERKDIKPFKGLLSEYMVFNRTLTKEEKLIIESNLAIKYGITLPTNDYFNSSKEVVWATKDNTNFSNRIAGIARDDQLKLNQKQAQSTAEGNVLTIGLNTIAPTNKENLSQLNDLDYMIWGDNAQPFVEDDFTNENRPNLSILKRNWLISTNEFSSKLPTQVKVDFSQLELPSNYQPVLLIDRKASTNFSIDDLEQVKISSLSENMTATFDNVIWDKDNSGRDIFAFGFIAIKPPIVEQFTIAPNPSKGLIDIFISLKETANITINIYNAEGRLMEQLERDGLNNYQLQSILKETGEYNIELKTPNSIETKKVIIVD